MSTEEPSRGGKPHRPSLLRAGLPSGYDLALRWALTLAVAVLVGFFAGRWLDLKLGTTPLFMLIGLFWSLAGSFLSLYLQLKRIQQEENEKPPESQNES